MGAPRPDGDDPDGGAGWMRATALVGWRGADEGARESGVTVREAGVG